MRCLKLPRHRTWHAIPSTLAHLYMGASISYPGQDDVGSRHAASWGEADGGPAPVGTSDQAVGLTTLYRWRGKGGYRSAADSST